MINVTFCLTWGLRGDDLEVEGRPQLLRAGLGMRGDEERRREIEIVHTVISYN